MGLGAPKKRTKLSHDPNNTNWARNTSNYGHKILTSQGWQPGQYLGAENANHAAHYTAANASHIRVMLREDNLGLGAGRGTSNAETFGLSTLSGIFGRLNGKSEGEVQKVQETQRDLGLRSWQAQRFGFMNFVSGGLLVGDKMEEPGQEKAAAESKGNAISKPVVEAEPQKKRKAEDPDTSVDSAAASKKKRKREKVVEGEKGSRKSGIKKKSKSKHRSETSDSESESELAAKRKKDKKRSNNSEAADDAEQSSKSKKRIKSAARDEPAPDDKARLKEEKRARKEERRKRKEEKRRLKESKSSKSASQSQDQSAESSDKDAEAVAEAVVAPTPVAQAMAFGGSRHAVRQRYIQQKRMAAMNPQAMQEILMLKAAG